MELVMGIILLVASVFLVVAVLMQSGKSHNLSGSIAGGAETFFGKTKGKVMDKMLSKLTTIVSIVFVLLVLIVYVIQPDTVVDPNKWFGDNYSSIGQTEETTAPDETEAPSGDVDLNADGGEVTSVETTTVAE